MSQDKIRENLEKEIEDKSIARCRMCGNTKKWNGYEETCKCGGSLTYWETNTILLLEAKLEQHKISFKAGQEKKAKEYEKYLEDYKQEMKELAKDDFLKKIDEFKVMSSEEFWEWVISKGEEQGWEMENIDEDSCDMAKLFLCKELKKEITE